MGEEALAAERHEMMDEADQLDGQTDLWTATIAARRKHIHDMAPCVDCGWPRALCDSLEAEHWAAHPDDDGPRGDFCSERPGMQGCRHRESESALAELLDEMLSGHVRTVAEVDPPPVQGPNLPGMAWLLSQAEWWYPHRRPAVRLAEMDKPHRYNTAQLLERKAGHLHATVGMLYMHDAPDDVWASFTQESPVEWLRGQPLMKALRRGLPTGGRKLAELQERARHWSTCPMRLKPRDTYPFPVHCTCTPGPAAEGGKPTAS